MGRTGKPDAPGGPRVPMFRPGESVALQPQHPSALVRPNFKAAHKLHDLMDGMVDGAKAEVAMLLTGGHLNHDEVNRTLKQFEAQSKGKTGFWEGARSPTKAGSPPRRPHRLSPDGLAQQRSGGARGRNLQSAASTSAYGSSVGTTGVQNTHGANTAAPTPAPHVLHEEVTSPDSSAAGSLPSSRGGSRAGSRQSVREDESPRQTSGRTGFERVDYYDSVFASTEDARDEPQACMLPQVPVFVNSITRTQQYSLFSSFDRHVLQRDKAYEKTPMSGAKTNRIVALERAMREDLKGCQGTGLDLMRQRLGVYSAYFAEIINDFPLFAPLLHDIKVEYDMYVNSLARQSPDIETLRRRLTDLLADDVRRNMLKIERRRVRTLEGQLTQLKIENEKLQNDLEAERNPSSLSMVPPVISKMPSSLAVTAPKLPEKTALSSSKGASTAAEAAAAAADDHGAGHILTALQSEVDMNVSEYSREIEELHAEITAHIEMIHKLKAEQKEKFVPVSVKNWLDDALKETELEIQRTIQDTANVRKETEMLRKRLIDVEKSVSSKEAEVSRVMVELEKVRAQGLLSFDFVPDADGKVDADHVREMISTAVNANIAPELSAHVLSADEVAAMATSVQQAVEHAQAVANAQAQIAQQQAQQNAQSLQASHKGSHGSSAALHKGEHSASSHARGEPVHKVASSTGSGIHKVNSASGGRDGRSSGSGHH